MTTKQYSQTAFWVKHIGLALALILVAAVLIYLQDKGFETGSGTPKEEKSVSRGLSEFYRDFRSSGSTDDESVGNFVVDLPASEQSLDQQLRKRSATLNPARDNWVGEYKYRSFKAGNTLREVITAYAEKEGMQVVWDLNQDFVIKHHFQLKSTLAGSLSQIASAVNSNFEGDVHTYICARQRSLVVTETQSDFLKKNCSRV